MKTISKIILGPMSVVPSSAALPEHEGDDPDEAIAARCVSSKRMSDHGRTSLSIGIAVGLHALLGMVQVARHVSPTLDRMISESDFVAVEPLAPETPAPPELAETPPPPPPRERPSEPRPADEPPANPAVGAVVPDEVPVTAPAEVATSTENGLAVNAVVGDGQGGSGSNVRHEGPAVEGPVTAPAAPAHDPRPFQRAYVQRLRGVVGAPRYSNSMRRRGIEGTVLIGVTVDPQGHASAVRVKRSSGDAELDGLVLEHVREHVANLPPPPPESEWRTREVPLAYEFTMMDD